MTGDDAATAASTMACARARDLFLRSRNTYGCAEVAFVALKEAFGLPDAEDSTAAMALNGGVAYSGATCGAVTGAALALGLLAGRRAGNHLRAKRIARLLTADLMRDFEAEFGSTSCRELIGVDLRTREGHRAFIAGGAWRDGCMRQLETVVRRLAPLGDPAAWDTAIARLEEA